MAKVRDKRSTKMAKCPNCGATMIGYICEYCHYTETTKSCNDSEERGTNNSYAHDYNVHMNMEYETATSPKDKIGALVLCIFLGAIGVHRFYVGKIGTGIIYLFTGGLFGFGWFIDALLIAFGKFKDSNGLPLK
jgi:ribosomal protein S27AE